MLSDVVFCQVYEFTQTKKFLFLHFVYMDCIIAAKLRQVIRSSKRHYWNAVCQNANDSSILYKTYRKIRTRSCSPIDAHFCLSHTDFLIPEANIQCEIFVDHFSEASDHEPLLLVYGNGDNEMLNCIFRIPELNETLRRTKSTSPGRIQ